VAALTLGTAVVKDIISLSKFNYPHTGCHCFFVYHREACHHTLFRWPHQVYVYTMEI
jgi:hypothetical protein